MPSLSELNDYYLALRAHYAAGEKAGPVARSFGGCFRPEASRFEKMLQVLLQSPKALQNLRQLTAGRGIYPASILALAVPGLEAALRPAGLAAQKAARLRALCALLAQKAGLGHNAAPASVADPAGEDADLSFLDDCPPEEFRRELLALRGIGPESADAILLFALDYPVFAVNAQTWRVLRRHGFVGAEAGYDELRELFHAALPEDAALFREYHGLLQALAVDFCRNSKFLCRTCPLGPYMEYEPCE